jgi:hypothetical protein
MKTRSQRRTKSLADTLTILDIVMRETQEETGLIVRHIIGKFEMILGKALRFDSILL